MPFIQYNPENKTQTHGTYFCPECKSDFYGGGEAIHNKECTGYKSYEKCIYIFGDKESWKLAFDLSYLPSDEIIKQATESPLQIIEY